MLIIIPHNQNLWILGEKKRGKWILYFTGQKWLLMFFLDIMFLDMYPCLTMWVSNIELCKPLLCTIFSFQMLATLRSSLLLMCAAHGPWDLDVNVLPGKREAQAWEHTSKIMSVLTYVLDNIGSSCSRSHSLSEAETAENAKVSWHSGLLNK